MNYDEGQSVVDLHTEAKKKKLQPILLILAKQIHILHTLYYVQPYIQLHIKSRIFFPLKSKIYKQLKIKL